MGTPLRLLAFLLAACPLLHGYDVPGFTPDQIIAFKQTTDSGGAPVTLNLDVFTPEGHRSTDRRPAIVFFFGGGWVSGSPSHFHPHCEYLAARGMVAVSAEYRIRNEHGTTPRECVKDGKSAIRYLRENAATLGIDPGRIAAGGGSAGGHVAAAAGTLTAFEERGENLAISSRPDALVLFNPVYDNGPGGYGHNRVSAYWEDISPLHNISATTPPAIVLFGTADHLVPVATARNFKALMAAEGVRSDLHFYQNQPHGFFNYDVPDDGKGPFHGYRDTVFKMDEFLVSLGYLSDPRGAPDPVTDWKTIFGDADFAAGSEATASPVTGDADADAIAANLDPLALADGDFIQLTGSASFDAPLSGAGFRIGLFDGDDPVTVDDDGGYAGIWAEAPATSDTNLVAGDGTGRGHPFEPAAGSVLA
jgi:acetyl esterase/lipase